MIILLHELIIPVPFTGESKSFRITGFFDVGNVYGPDEAVQLSELRTSTGIAGIWLSPLGPLTVSFAVPLKTQDNDDEQPFQFTFGTSF